MAKIDTQLAAITNGFQNVAVSIGTTLIADDQMEALGVRRRKAGQAQHLLWYLSVGENGAQPATFWGHRISDVINKGLEWRGLPTKNKRGPKAPNGQQASA